MSSNLHDQTKLEGKLVSLLPSQIPLSSDLSTVLLELLSLVPSIRMSRQLLFLLLRQTAQPLSLHLVFPLHHPVLGPLVL